MQERSPTGINGCNQSAVSIHVFDVRLKGVREHVEMNVSLFDPSTNSHPVQNIRTCWRIIYMFVCSLTSCLGVVNVDIDQNHQLWWSPPGSSINEVRTCQLNPGQIEEANVCFNVTASSQRGLGSGLTPGLTALPDHILKDRPKVYVYVLKMWVSLLKTFSDMLLTGQLAGKVK